MYTFKQKIFYKIIIFVNIMGFLLFMFGCSPKNDYEKYNNETWGLSISYPKEWVVADTSEDSSLNVMFSKEEFSYSKPNEAAISIVGVKGDQGAAFVDQMEESVNSKQQTNKVEDIKIDKMDAKKITINEGDQENISYIFLKHNDNNCVVFYSVKDSKQEYLTIIESMINSIKLN